MTGLIVRRLLQMPIILFVIYTITFSLAWLIPGNPLENPEGRRPPQVIMQAMLEQYKLDNPWSFYWDYLGKATGVSWLLGQHDRPFDLGPSLTHQDWTVNEILAAGLPVSITLGLLAILLACAIGLTAGIIGGIRPGSVADLVTLLIALVGISLPSFVIGTLLLVIFGVWLKVFPIGGWGKLSYTFLPALTLALPFAAYIARLTRFGMIDELATDYIRTARAKGVPQMRVVLKHALKNAFLPVLSFLGPAAAMAMTGSFVVEKVFAVPGIGTHFVNAVLSKDITLIMGVVLVYSTMLILFNLVVDVLYRWVDPRIELG
ncbi:MAG: ABC transporter permease [Planctomycetota bacterium]|nr:ABC transporter permease [Planctomycetota bacterium]MCZ6492873.1 ABC transporter permease [Planctomycetota bacterium]MCZ6542671.1 ABC transporter permease [Planctomycetota bacterium]MCZ6850809.1 ABC transporter permease [Planctomycetota bacterium]